jgi:hypothetical protein
MNATELMGLFFSSWMAWPVYLCATAIASYYIHEKLLRRKNEDN